jgi:hypothetical protein
MSQTTELEPHGQVRCDWDDGPVNEDGSAVQCERPSRFRLERPGDGYVPSEACEFHVADTAGILADGQDIPITIRIHWDGSRD